MGQRVVEDTRGCSIVVDLFGGEGGLMRSVWAAGSSELNAHRLMLIQADALVGIVGGHVGQDDAVAGLEAADDFDRVDGTPSELDRDAGCINLVGVELEDVHSAAFLAEGRPADVNDVVETLEFNRAIDAQVGPRALGEFAGERDVDRDRAVLNLGVDARDPSGHDAIARVDRGVLADLNILGLRLGDAHLGLQAGRIGHPRDVGARLDLGTDLDGQHLKHPGHARAHVEGIGFVAAQFRLGADPIDLGVFDGQLRSDHLLGKGIPFLLDRVLGVGVLGGDFRATQFESGDQTIFEQLVIDLRLQAGDLKFGLGAGEGRLGVEHAFFDGHLEVRQLSFSRLELRGRTGGVFHHRRVAEDQDDAVRCDEGARTKHDAIDTALGARSDPADLFRHERAQTADLPDHRPARHGADPDKIPLDRGCGRLETRKGESHADQGDHDNTRDDDAFSALLLGGVGAGNVHELVVVVRSICIACAKLRRMS